MLSHYYWHADIIIDIEYFLFIFILLRRHITGQLAAILSCFQFRELSFLRIAID
jgi:hypothetical protein